MIQTRDPESLKKLNVDDLKQICRENNIHPFSKKKKLDLINMIVSFFEKDRIVLIPSSYPSETKKLKIDTVFIQDDPDIITIPEEIRYTVKPNDSRYIKSLTKLNEHEKEWIESYVYHYLGAGLKELIFKKNLDSNLLIFSPPEIVWNGEADINERRYYLYWKNEILKDSDNIGRYVAVYDNGAKIYISEFKADILKKLREKNVEIYFDTRVAREGLPAVLALSSPSSTSKSNDAVFYLNNWEIPHEMCGQAFNNSVNDPVSGFYIDDRRWIKVYIKGKDDKVYYLYFLMDTGSPVTFLHPESRKILGIEHANGTGKVHRDRGKVYNITISGIDITAFASEDCVGNEAVKDINLLGTDFLSHFVTIDIFRKKTLIVTKYAATPEVLSLEDKIKAEKAKKN